MNFAISFRPKLLDALKSYSRQDFTADLIAGLTGPLLRETAGVIVPPLILLALSLWLGVATPSVLQEAWDAAVRSIAPAP